MKSKHRIRTNTNIKNHYFSLGIRPISSYTHLVIGFNHKASLPGSSYCRSVREFLDRRLPLHADIDSLIIDRFHSIRNRIGQNWDLLSKQNLLISTIPSDQLMDELKQHFSSDPNAMGELTEIQRLLLPEELRRQSLSGQLERLYEIKANRIAQGQPTTTQDEMIRRVKQELRRMPQLQEGEILGERYKLLSMLGRGGFARVYQAYDLRTKSLVAVKVLHSESSDEPRRLARFERGARQMESLNHPRIVRVLSGPAEQDGFHYFVMEYLNGGDLSKIITKKSLNAIDKLRILIEVGSALQFAHQHNLIHRDVKPENILLDNNQKAKLTDFDLVWAADSTGGTNSKAGLGTFLYAAPEQLTEAAMVTSSADVYSLAMLAIFLIKGKIPIWFREYRTNIIYKLPLNQDAQLILDRATQSNPVYRPTLTDFLRILTTNWPIERASQIKHRQTLIQNQEYMEKSSAPTLVDPAATIKSPAHPRNEPGISQHDFHNQKIQLQIHANKQSQQTRFISSNPIWSSFRIFLLASTALIITSQDIINSQKSNWLEEETTQSKYLLQEIAINIKNEHWNEALSNADKLLTNNSSPIEITQIATALKKQAQDEKSFFGLYDRLQSAYSKSDWDAVVQNAMQIPSTSAYFARSKQKYDVAFHIYIDKHIKAAVAARDHGNCIQFRSQLQMIFQVAPGHLRALQEKKLFCTKMNSLQKENSAATSLVRQARTPRVSSASKRVSSAQNAPAASHPTQDAKSSKTQPAFDIETVLAESKIELMNGHYEQAIALGQKALKNDPTSTKAQRAIAEAACRSKYIPFIQKSFQQLDATGQPLFREICQRVGVVWLGSEFVIR